MATKMTLEDLIQEAVSPDIETDIQVNSTPDTVVTNDVDLQAETPQSKRHEDLHTIELNGATPTQSPQGQDKTTKIKHTYSLEDTGPYFVTIKFKRDLINQMHPLKLGRWLFHNNYEVQHILKTGASQIEAHFRGPFEANKFLQSNFDAVHDTESFIPFYNLHVHGVIRGVDTDITEQEIMHYINSTSTLKVIRVHRFTKKVESDNKVTYEPLRLVKLTFRKQQLPAHIYLFYQRFQVSPYKEKVTVCGNCGKYNHREKYCRNPRRCVKCGLVHDKGQTECADVPLTCINCRMGHAPTDTKNCPAYALEQSINDKVQALPISRYEARQLLLGHTTYAEVVQRQQDNPRHQGNRGELNWRQSRKQDTPFPPINTTYSQKQPMKRKTVDPANYSEKRMAVALIAPTGRWPHYSRTAETKQTPIRQPSAEHDQQARSPTPQQSLEHPGTNRGGPSTANQGPRDHTGLYHQLISEDGHYPPEEEALRQHLVKFLAQPPQLWPQHLRTALLQAMALK